MASGIAAKVAAWIVAIAGIGAITIVTPAVTRRPPRLVIARYRGRCVITRCGGVIAWLGRYIDSPLLVISRAIAIVIGISTSNDSCGLGIHSGFVVTGTSIATSKSQSQ
jgi:hypothetical protein